MIRHKPSLFDLVLSFLLNFKDEEKSSVNLQGYIRNNIYSGIVSFIHNHYHCRIEEGHVLLFPPPPPDKIILDPPLNKNFE